jgi:uronate dehydrogenase
MMSTRDTGALAQRAGRRPLVVGGGTEAAQLASLLRGRYAPLDAVQTEADARAAVAGAPVVVLLAAADEDVPRSEALRRLFTAAYRVSSAVAAHPRRRIVLVSGLSFFARCPENWRVDARWRPRPTPELADVASHLTELSVREATRETGVDVRVIRRGEDVSLAALADAVRDETRTSPDRFLEVRHLGERPAAPADDRPWRTVLAAPDPVPSRPIRNVVVFGAGGPFAAAVTPLLMARYRVRLTDVRPLAEIRAAGHPHQPPGSPLPTPPDPPHEEMLCDITDPDQVRDACAGMDAIINLSVVRNTDHDFAVNTIGCDNIARAAVHHRIRRVVQTGPQLTAIDDHVGYQTDYDVPGDAPARPGRYLYGHTKYLGFEVLRIFAEYHDLEVPVLVFNGFVTAATRSNGVFQSTFEECADAILRALEVPSLPSPYEYITVCADLPQGRFSSRRATELLGWHTQDHLEDTWRD